MIDTWIVVDVALGILIGLLACALLAMAVVVVDDRLYHRRQRRSSRRRRDRRDLEGPDAIEAWGESIPTIWPTRAPRNGNPFDDGGHAEEASA